MGSRQTLTDVIVVAEKAYRHRLDSLEEHLHKEGLQETAVLGTGGMFTGSIAREKADALRNAPGGKGVLTSEEKTTVSNALCLPPCPSSSGLLAGGRVLPPRPVA